MDIKDIAAIADTYDQLRETGIMYQKKTVESLLAFSVVVYTLKQKCEHEEQDFSSKSLEYWGLSASGASQAAKVGERSEKFVSYANVLPASSRTLYELATIPEKKFEEVIEMGDVTPNLTVTEAKSLKASLKDDKKKEELENPFDAPPTDSGPGGIGEGGADSNNIIDAEVTDVEIKEELKPKKLTAPEAVDMLNINVKKYYNEMKGSPLFSSQRLADAYKVLTGENI